MQINYSNSKQSGRNNKPRQATSWIPLNFDIMTTYIIESPNGETHKLEVFRTATGFNVYVDDSNICESITEEDFLQELENPTF